MTDWKGCGRKLSWSNLRYRCSKSHATHGEMQYKFYFCIIMPVSYNKCRKCPPLRSSQRCTRRIMLANTFCNVPVDILSTVRRMLAWSSCSVCGWFEYTVSLRCPINRSLGGLSPGIVEATISLKWGVQETQIPSKTWIAWLFEHPVLSRHLPGGTEEIHKKPQSG
jgi:hypothetical protein